MAQTTESSAIKLPFLLLPFFCSIIPLPVSPSPNCRHLILPFHDLSFASLSLFRRRLVLSSPFASVLRLCLFLSRSLLFDRSNAVNFSVSTGVGVGCCAPIWTGTSRGICAKPKRIFLWGEAGWLSKFDMISCITAFGHLIRIHNWTLESRPLHQKFRTHSLPKILLKLQTPLAEFTMTPLVWNEINGMCTYNRCLDVHWYRTITRPGISGLSIIKAKSSSENLAEMWRTFYPVGEI